MEFTDYYQALGVERSASDEDIRRAYRKLARKYHPDVSKEPDAQAQMRAVNEAYQTLGDKEKRAAYDALAERVARGGAAADGHDGFHAPPGWDEGFEFRTGPGGEGPQDFSEFFSAMFRDAQRQRRGAGDAPHAQPHAMRGEDHHASIEISLEDALQGSQREISLRALEIDANGQPQWATRTLDVKIPPGVRPGQFIRLAGQGMPGAAGGPAGDLYLEVRIAPHPRYRFEGNDILMTLPITPTEAALGAQVHTPTPQGGVVEVTVPAGARAGMKLRLKERGFASKPPGHLYLVLDIALPPVANDAVRAAYQALAQAAPFNPRASLGV